MTVGLLPPSRREVMTCPYALWYKNQMSYSRGQDWMLLCLPFVVWFMLSLKTRTQLSTQNEIPPTLQGPLHALPPVRSCPSLLLPSRLTIHHVCPSPCPTAGTFRNPCLFSHLEPLYPIGLVRCLLLPLLLLKNLLQEASLDPHPPSWLAA